MSNFAKEILSLANSAAEQASDEFEHRAYGSIAKTVRLLEAGLFGKSLSPEEFIAAGGELISPVPEPDPWQPDTLEAALAVDVAQADYEEAERLLSAAHRAFTRAAQPSPLGRASKNERRELELAVAAAAVDLEASGERLLTATVAHSALVRRDQHGDRVERLAQMDAESERQRKAAARERRKKFKAGRATLRKLVDKVGQ